MLKHSEGSPVNASPLPSASTDEKADGLKRCQHCKQHLPKTRFYRNSAKEDGLTHYCIACIKQWKHDEWKRKSANPEWLSQYCHKRHLYRKTHKKKSERGKYLEQKLKYSREYTQRPEVKARRKLYYAKGDPQKHMARSRVGYALKHGKLKRGPCEICGKPNGQAHHKDYSKPLDVQWLCFKHHVEVHYGPMPVLP